MAFGICHFFLSADLEQNAADDSGKFLREK
jgi:hypothetical protein